MLLLLATFAAAHPMGSASVNRSGVLAVTPDGTRLQYTVEFAEEPSVDEQERVLEVGREAYAAARIAELLPALSVTVDGAPWPLTVDGCFETTSKGDADLPNVSLFCQLDAPPIPHGRVTVRDGNFAGPPGWRELVIVAADAREGDPADAARTGEVPLPFSSPPERMVLASASATVGPAAGGTPWWWWVAGALVAVALFGWAARRGR